MKNVSLFCVTLCLSSLTFAQNLVPNADFEIRIADYCGIATPSDLNTTLDSWYSPSAGSPDIYFTDIAPSCWNFQPNSTYSGPVGIKGSQNPRSGSTMIGLGTYTVAGLDQREFIQIGLTSTMVPTGKYLVECYVSLADNHESASNSLGFYLSTVGHSSGSNGPLSATPQYVSMDVIGETQDWVRVADTITITDAYNYLTIGNFNDDASTTTVPNPSASGAPGTYGAYYFIDDVRVERIFTDISNVNELESLKVRVFPNPTSDEVSVELENGKGQLKIKLVDVNGKVVTSIEDNSDSVTINMKDLEDGIYFIHVHNELGQYTEKIVKN